MLVPAMEARVEQRGSSLRRWLGCADLRALREVARIAAEGEIRGVVGTAASDRVDVLDVEEAVGENLRCVTILATLPSPALDKSPYIVRDVGHSQSAALCR